MRILPYRPTFPVSSIQSVMDELFDRNINGILGGDQLVTWPHTNILEEKSHYIIEIAAPGFEKNSFEITVKGEKLFIEAAKKNENSQPENARKWLRREYHYDQFKRTFKLPENVAADNTEASYELGILKIKIAKKTTEAENQQLKIAVS